MRSLKVRYLLFPLMLLAAGEGRAAEPSPAAREFSYPELQVVPRASQTLAKEANEEKAGAYRRHLLLEIPGIMTFSAGLAATRLSDPKSKEASQIATGIGLAWIVAGAGMSAFYTPYQDGRNEIKGLSEKSMEQNLSRERRAEEVLAFPASLMRKVQYIAAVTNFGASVNIAALEEKDSQVKTLSYLAAASALLPLIFEHPWITIYDQQMEYKKKIYGPVAQLSVDSERLGGKTAPSLRLSLSF